MTGASLKLEEVTVLRDGHALFQPLSLTIAPGEAVSVMGPSGSGKSSLLNHICGALPKGLEGRGRVLLDGQDLKGLPLERRRIGILFQDDLLFPHLSVAENLAFGLSPAYRSRAERAARIESALTEAASVTPQPCPGASAPGLR